MSIILKIFIRAPVTTCLCVETAEKINGDFRFIQTKHIIRYKDCHVASNRLESPHDTKLRSDGVDLGWKERETGHVVELLRVHEETARRRT